MQSFKPCSVGFSPSGDIEFHAVYTTPDFAKESANHCMLFSERKNLSDHKFFDPMLFPVFVYVSEKRAKLFEGGWSTLGQAWDIWVWRIPWWRRLLTIFKPVVLWGYEVKKKAGDSKVTVTEYKITVRYFPRRKIELHKVRTVTFPARR